MSGVRKIQEGLKELGYNPGVVDGIFGPNTEKAAKAWLEASGRKNEFVPPWVAEGQRVLSLHEKLDKTELTKFLKSDGDFLGDPSQFPWCGDFIHTCIQLALPDEPFPGALGENPYWARNWALFGKASPPAVGAVAVFARDGGGHVAFLVGEGETMYKVLGGNQSNRVSEMMIAKDRLVKNGIRWPLTTKLPQKTLPRVKDNGAPLSTNEA